MGFRELARDVAAELRGHGYHTAVVGFVVLFTREVECIRGGYVLFGADEFETGPYLNFDPSNLLNINLIPEAIISYRDRRRVSSYTSTRTDIPFLDFVVENARATHDTGTHL